MLFMFYSSQLRSTTESPSDCIDTSISSTGSESHQNGSRQQSRRAIHLWRQAPPFLPTEATVVAVGTR